MAKRLGVLLGSVWRWLRRGRAERRAAVKRAHFWSEVRAGEREADHLLHP